MNLIKLEKKFKFLNIKQFNYFKKSLFYLIN